MHEAREVVSGLVLAHVERDLILKLVTEQLKWRLTKLLENEQHFYEPNAWAFSLVARPITWKSSEASESEQEAA